MSKGENELLSPDFESGMSVGFADGLSLMHQMLTGAVSNSPAPTNPGKMQCLPEWFC